MVANLVAAVRDTSDSERFGQYSVALHNLLLEPVKRDLMGSDRIVIVPQGVLERVPFPSLLDPRSNRFLIEEHPVAMAPSSTIFVAASNEAGERQSKTTFTSLAVGNPAFDQSTHPDLTDLPAAADEARSLAARTPGSMLLTRGDATIARFLEAVDDHDFIHFGGHALVDRSLPGGSRLLFAASRGETGDLLGEKIYHLRLTRPRLVVLSACDTGRGAYRGLEGTSDLARPFLAAGAPAVLVSLWRVSDRESKAFWEAFYDALYGGAETGAALQRAQLAMMRHGEISFHKPRAWAGYRLVGAL